MEKRTILLIEDEKALRESLKTIIEVCNFDTLQAENGIVGLNILADRSNKVDLILCDINLPDISGYDIIKLVKNDPDLYNIPFLFLTAYADERDVRNGMNLGADDYLTKPFSAKELISAINSRIALKERSKSYYERDVRKQLVSMINTNFKQEFYTPLNSILNACFLLNSVEGPVHKSLFEDAISAIYTSSYRMFRDSRNLVVFSLINANEDLAHVPDDKIVKVHNVLQDTLNYFNNGLLAGATKLKCSMEQVQVLNMDPEFLNIVFTELIDNAVKFSSTKELPEITLSDSKNNGFIFTVTNTVSPTTNFSIKDVAPFKKFHPDHSLNGFGIGLYLCKTLCSKIGYEFDIKIENGLFVASVVQMTY